MDDMWNGALESGISGLSLCAQPLGLVPTDSDTTQTKVTKKNDTCVAHFRTRSLRYSSFWWVGKKVRKPAAPKASMAMRRRTMVYGCTFLLSRYWWDTSRWEGQGKDSDR